MHKTLFFCGTSLYLEELLIKRNLTSLRGGFFEARISFNGFELKINFFFTFLSNWEAQKKKKKYVVWKKFFNYLEEQQYCVIKDFLASFTFPLSLRFL